MRLDCVKFENCYILLIHVIDFKLCLINFVYFFLRHPVDLPVSRSRTEHGYCSDSNINALVSRF